MSIIKSIQAINTKGTSIGVSGVVNPAEYRIGMADLFLPGGQGPLERFAYSDCNSSLKAYTECPPITAIINKKAQAYVNGKTWVMDMDGKESKSQFADKLRARLARPNPLQNWKQFDAQNYIYKQLFGFCPVLPIMPVGWKERVDCTSMWNIPGSMLTTKETGKLWYQTDLAGIIDSIIVTYRGTETTLPLEWLHIFNDFTPSFSSMVFAESRIKGLAMPINNIIGAYESRHVLIKYRGAMGVLSNDSRDGSGYIPIVQKEKEVLQQDFKRYGLLQSQFKFIISSAALKWQQIGIPTRDLMLFEEIEDDIYRCCDSYNYPAYLMAGSKGGTYSNVGEAKQSLYQDTIIPEAESGFDQWNEFFNCTANGCIMQKDYSHVPALQEDKAKQATARSTLGQEVDREFKNNMITYNRALEILDEDTVTGMDKYYYQLLAEGWTFGPVAMRAQTVLAEPDPGAVAPATNQNG